MCRGVCFVVSRTHEIYSSEKFISSHENIIGENNIRDGLLGNIVRIEMLPNNNLFSKKREDWDCSVDEKDPPEWFNENKEELVDKCYNKLWSIIETWSVNNRIDGTIELNCTKIKSLGKLEHIGYLDLTGTAIRSLGNLKTVVGYLDLYGTKVKTLAKLQSVGGWLDIRSTQIKTLKNLKHIGGSLFVRKFQLIITIDNIINDSIIYY